MRSIWSGTIGFGLVNIPVKLYTASQESRLDLDMLDKRDHARIRYQTINADTGKVVSRDNIVKGYKYEDEYVILEPEDFEAASPAKNKIIEIQNFVDQDEIDPLYYESPYYIEPDKGGVKAYSLLLAALKKSKKVGIATFVLRNSESLVMIRPGDNVLILNKMRFAEEVRDHRDLTLPARDNVKENEMEMALALIGSYTSEFDISTYKDTYTDSLLKIIKAKASGKSPRKKTVPLRPTRSDDLMAQLKASLSGPAKKKAS